MVGVSPVGGGTGLHIGVVALTRLERSVQGEQGVGVLGAEVAAVFRVAGLQQYWMALRPRGQRGDAADVELRTVMLDGVDSGRIGVDPGGDVGNHRVGCPAVPEPPCNGDELLGPFVSIGVVEEAAAAEVLPGERVGGGDHIPGRSPVG